MVKMTKENIFWFFTSIFILTGVSLIVVGGIVKITCGNLSESVYDGRFIFFPESPKIVKAVYYSGSTAGNPEKINYLIEASKNDLINAVVIDVKDSSGFLTYNTDIPEAEEYGSEKNNISDIKSLLANLHANGIYTIGRIVVFQDSVLARAKPEWAVKNRKIGGIWRNNLGLSWIDPAASQSWNYFADVAVDAISVGFDEINFDYIRFPSDGDMEAMVFPFWNRTEDRRNILTDFYKFMRGSLGNARMSADLFGFIMTRNDDFGVGQIAEDAFNYFDFISPMVYPSHYPSGFLGFSNPAEYPYEVVYNAMKNGRERLLNFKNTNGNLRPKIRPWLQDFDMGANYDKQMVIRQVDAAIDGLGDEYSGFMLWNAKNLYDYLNP